MHAAQAVQSDIDTLVVPDHDSDVESRGETPDVLLADLLKDILDVLIDVLRIVYSPELDKRLPQKIPEVIRRGIVLERLLQRLARAGQIIGLPADARLESGILRVA